MNRIQIKARGFTFDAWSAGPKDGPLILLLYGFPILISVPYPILANINSTSINPNLGNLDILHNYRKTRRD